MQTDQSIILKCVLKICFSLCIPSTNLNAAVAGAGQQLWWGENNIQCCCCLMEGLLSSIYQPYHITKLHSIFAAHSTTVSPCITSTRCECVPL